MSKKENNNQGEPKTREEEWQKLSNLIHDLSNQAAYLQMSDKTKNKKSK